MKKALVIGVSGQDGAYLANLLIDKGYDVIGTTRGLESSSFNNLKQLGLLNKIEIISMPPSDLCSVKNVVQKVDPDEIYNLAGQTSVNISFTQPIETFDSIFNGTINLLESIRLLEHPARIFNAGSSEIFGNTITPATEKTPFNPRSPYATAKAASHYAVMNYREAYGLFACTGILFNHESPLRPCRFVTKKIISSVVRIANGSSEKVELGKIDIIRDWGWAPDYVDAMWLILQHSSPDDYVIATGQGHSLEDFLTSSFKCFGLDWKDHVCVRPNLLRPMDIEKSIGDPAKARIKLKWAAKFQFDDVIKQLIVGEVEHMITQNVKLKDEVMKVLI